MKIKQQLTFVPIELTIESKKELDALEYICRFFLNDSAVGYLDQRQTAVNIINLIAEIK